MTSRKLNARELANLPDTGYENFTEDPRVYRASITAAWEVDEETYNKLVYEEGCLGREYQGKFYVAETGSWENLF